MVEMHIDSLTIDHQKRLPIILLREYFGRGRTLAIPVGSIEGMALSLVLNNEILPKPLTHDLVLACLRTFNAKLSYAEITSFNDGIFEAYIVFSQKQKGFRLEARPSDAITLAVRSGQPIYVDESVFKSVDETQKESSKKLTVPNPTVDAASDMLKRTSAKHVVEIMSLARHHSDGIPPRIKLHDDQLLELLRCLEPENRQKM